jgi:hypothetical protein
MRNFKTDVSGCDERIERRKPDANAFRLMKSTVRFCGSDTSSLAEALLLAG